MSHFLSGAIGAGALAVFLHSIVGKAILIPACVALYVGGSMAINGWYFRLGQGLDPPN